MKITELRIPINIVFPDSSFLLLGITPQFKYENGKKTDIQIGTVYEVVEDTTFEKFKVKVACTTPLITPEQFENAKTRLAVSFDACIAKPYRTDKGTYELSYSAEAVHLIK